MIKETRTLINAVKKMYPVVEFIHNRYFPDGKSYYSEKVLIETKKQGRKVAPFVIPQVNGIAIEAEGYRQDEVEAPYIAPKMVITKRDIAKKAFGEDPGSTRSEADRANELEADDLDELRRTILRRKELMDAEIFTTGQLVMDHYASSEDAVAKKNGKQMILRFYDHEFKNRYLLTKKFSEMTASEIIQMFYDMASILQRRGVKASDIILTSDVTARIMSDKDFLEFYNKARALIGTIAPIETPDGVSSLGTININGINFTIFSYDETYEDLDGTIKPIFPKGTIIMAAPNMGTTAYAQVSFVQDNGFVSYAAPIVPRVLASETNNVIEVQEFSRPVPFPFDWDSWLVANVNDEIVTQDVADNAVDTNEPKQSAATLKSIAEVEALKSKAEVVAYAESIGLSGLSKDDRLQDLIDATVAYQTEKYGE